MARVDGHLMALEVPGAWAKVTIHDRDLLTLLHDLSIGRAASEMANQGSHPEEAILATLALMSWCELLENVNEEGWPAHELLFHSRTRRGYARVLLGKSDIAGESVGASDGSHGEGKGRIALELPDWSRLLAGDPPHALVADRRRSIRRQGSIPITSKQLSELLFRTLHEKEGRRPYPSGGACYPLNAYVAIHSCSGVPAGFYFYSPVRHELVTVSGAGPGVDRLVADAAGAANLDRLPQILLVLAARFTCTRRVYGDLGYSLILKEVGGVFQTALMAAAAMGLAACPLGCGDSLEFSRLTRVDPLIETSVGELILGSLGDVV
jgi:SagB-type dehydrogenase family enzyme